MSINRVTISGNLTRDPEIRSTASGMNILSFGVAVNDRRRNSTTGEWEDYPNFVDCVLFGNRAEFLSRTLHKGSRVMVDGKLRYSSWERDGQRRSKLEVVADDVDFILPPRNQDGYQGGYQPQGGNYQQRSGNGNGAPSFNAPAPQQNYGNAPAPQQNYGAPAPQQGQGQQQSQGQQPNVNTPYPEGDVYDDDIPF